MRSTYPLRIARNHNDLRLSHRTGAIAFLHQRGEGPQAEQLHI